MSNNTEMIHNNMDPTITCHSPKMESSNNPYTYITVHNAGVALDKVTLYSKLTTVYKFLINNKT